MAKLEGTKVNTLIQRMGMAFTNKFGTPDINEAQAKLKKLQSARVNFGSARIPLKLSMKLLMSNTKI